MRILGIESSCDETAASVLDYSRGRFSVRSNVIYSQVKTHAKTGGVVPEVAAREHSVKIVPVIAAALKRSEATPASISAIGVTAGPGLVTALLVGVEAARTLAYIWRKPLIPINHIEGHVAANWLGNTLIRFPALCLVVSGGHTEFLLMKDLDHFHCVGRTLDDAAGEAFDKVAKLLGLGYPGGPAISKIAEHGDAKRYLLPRPMLTSKNLDFSFAGIKTAVLYRAKGIPGKAKPKNISVPDLAASFQQAVIDVLVAKTLAAARTHHPKTVLLAGGVAASSELRTQLASAVASALPGTTYCQPSLGYCTDNAAMIAARAAFAYTRSKRWPWQDVRADPNWETWESQ